jgi:hypothetical protein
VKNKQSLNWMRLDREKSIVDDSELYRLLVNFSTEGFALDLKVRMSAEDVIGALRSLATRMEHQLGLNQHLLQDEPGDDWQPIATAPKDGSHILAFFDKDPIYKSDEPSDRMAIVKWSGEQSLWTMPGIGGLSPVLWKRLERPVLNRPAPRENPQWTPEEIAAAKERPHVHLWSGIGPDAYCLGCNSQRTKAEHG